METMKEKLWTKQYILVISMTILFFLSMQSLLGGFPIYVANMTQDPASGGLMTTAFMLAAVLSRPFIGVIIPKINMKQWLIRSILFTVAMVVLSYFTTSLGLLILLRVMQGIGFGFITTLFATLATNLIPSPRLGEGIGYFGMSTSIGSTLGPMMAILMIHSFSFKTVLVFSFLMLVLVWLASYWVKSPPILVKANDEPKASIMQAAFDRKAFLPCFLVMLFYITFAGVVNFLDGLGEVSGLGGQTSIFFLFIAIMLVATRPFSGIIFDRFGHKYLIYPASFAAIIGLVLLAKTGSMYTLVFAGIFYGFAYGVMQPTFQAWAVSQVSPEKKATANAMSLSFMDLGQAIGAFALGRTAGIIGYHSMYGVAAITIAVLLVIYLSIHLVINKKRRQILNQEQADVV
ncbi:MFS transporter [Bacillus sp. SD088]|nr:MFS transporter [Bacillus sp. SD088]